MAAAMSAGKSASRLLEYGAVICLALVLALVMCAPALAAPPDPPSTEAAAPVSFPSAEEQQEIIAEAREKAAEVDRQIGQIEDLASASPDTASAAEEARRHAAEVQRRMEEIQRLSETISEKQADVLRASAELDVMDRELALVIEEYNRRMIELEEARFKTQRLEGELELVKEQLVILEKSLEDRVVGTYKKSSSTLEVLLDTTDLKDLVRRLSLLVDVAQHDRERLDDIEALRSRVDRLLDELSRHIYEVTVASEKLDVQRTAIEDKMAERQAFIDELSAEIRALVDEQREVARNIVPVDLDLSAYLAGDGNAVVKTALKYLGIPYVWGGETPAGFDCSGLVLYVFRQHGVYLPHYSRYQATMGYAVPRSQAAAGDLVFFGTPVHHVGIYMGDDMYVHAPRTGDVVKVSRLSARNDLTHVRRFTFAPSAPSVGGPGDGTRAAETVTAPSAP